MHPTEAASAQVGRHENVVEALGAATRTDGARGLFRGTGALLSREVPFYVFGMMGYAQLKKIFNGACYRSFHAVASTSVVRALGMRHDCLKLCCAGTSSSYSGSVPASFQHLHFRFPLHAERR
jgi:hypothetical protein